MKRIVLGGLLSGLLLTAAAAPAAATNVVIFVADGLRYASVTPDVAPTLARIRREGVDFANSHAMYPTLTTANASAIATGHYLGDTGDYANVLYAGGPVAALQGSDVVFLENDAVLKELRARFGSGYMGPTSLLCAAHDAGDGAAVVGKTGPAAIQSIGCDGTIVLDDMWGRSVTADGTPSGAFTLEPTLAGMIATLVGTDKVPLTPTPSDFPNRAQQAWLTMATDEAVLPKLAARRKPFALLFWSRDPDMTQHAQMDSLGTLNPGINGPTAKAAIANADTNLATLLHALADLGLDKTTDVFVTADHGFSTIAKSIPDAKGVLPPPNHPAGFLAIDVSQWLGANIFDPVQGYQELDLANGEHPSSGSAIIGASADAPMAIVAANGGSDFIYTPGADGRAHAKQIFDHLLAASYVGALFVNDDLLKNGDAKDFAGALPMSAIRLIGAARVPEPAIVVGFRNFDAKGCKLGAELCSVEIADTGLQTGQGMHGSFSRADTRNFMAAIGPDFKAHYVDKAPVGNADIAPTLAHLLGVDLAANNPNAGTLTGRVVTEALRGGGKVAVTQKVLRSAPAANGLQTVLDEQLVGDTAYFDAAGIPGRTVGLKEK